MKARSKYAATELLRELHTLALHNPKDKKIGPSIYQTAHDPFLHDEGKSCPHCRATSIVHELIDILEKEPVDAQEHAE